MKKIALAPLLAFIIFAAPCAWSQSNGSVQTYTDQAVPSDTPRQYDRFNSPVAAGRLTLEDVLQAHKPPAATKPAKAAASKSGLRVPAIVAPAATPTAVAPSSSSSANAMMMQGMKNVLEQSDNGILPQQALAAPQMHLQPAVPSLTAQTPSYPSAPVAAYAAPMPIVPAGMAYQPGEGPQNLASEVVSASSTYPPVSNVAPVRGTVSAQPRAAWQPPLPPIPVPVATSPVMQPIALTPSRPATTAWPPVGPNAQDVTTTVTTDTVTYTPPPIPVAPSLPAAPAVVKSGAWTANGVAAVNCTPRVETWTKTCAEAGYPANFTGKITGETHTNCPDGTKQDVWIANSCAQAGSAETAIAPAAAIAPASVAPEAPAPMMPAEPAPVDAESSEAAPPPPPALSATETMSSMPQPAVGVSSYAPPAPETPAVPLAVAAPVAIAPAAGVPSTWPAPPSASAPVLAPAPAPVFITPPPPAMAPVMAPVMTSTPSLPMQMPVARADASCGPANGLAVSAMPTLDLCSSGSASSVTGVGPWRWNCRGASGGMNVSCAAPFVPAAAPAPSPAMQKSMAAPAPVVEDALCGSSDGGGVTQAPASNLCARGIPSRVSGNGPWSWACSGTNGGQAVVCGASRKTDGACGATSQVGSDQMPATDLCAAGYASAVTGEGPWNWTCSGMNGGSAATCSAALKTNAVCGSATLMGRKDAPQDGLCSVGHASAVHGTGPWTWSCGGSSGGSSVACTAAVSVSGACGAANGVAAMQPPAANLCARGYAARVTGSGPWAWNCAGKDGGDSESCTAPLATPVPAEAMPVPVPDTSSSMTSPAPSMAAADTSMCGSASELMAIEAPSKGLCATGSPGELGGSGPWTWTCADASGHTSSCSTLSLESYKPKTRASSSAAPSTMMLPATMTPPAEERVSCGNAAGQGATRTPSEGLCAVGKASSVRGFGPWNWVCVKGKNTVACTAPKLVNASCGLANGSVQTSVPVKDLCSQGSATDVHGAGPWLWSCVGSGGGASISCSAASQAQTRVDGSCGAASSMPANIVPATNLCDSGIPSMVYGDGPWTWTCSGLNGGIATSCSTQKSTPPAPPPPGPSVNGVCGSNNGVAMVVQPMDDLCTGGTATSVSGNGPWNWNCIGENGGMTVSCTAPMQPPSPITGVCGAASGVPTLTIPRSGLCSAGISSSVSGRGPWTWSCSGTNGGGAVGCVAPLAGTDVGSLPSYSSTPASNEAPVPMAAPVPAVMNSGLVTPTLPAGPLPPLETGSLPSNTFPAMPPQPSALPSMSPPSFGDQMLAPTSPPELPSDVTPLNPPPIRDSIAPSPALKPPAIDMSGNMIPGNHFKLPDDVTTLPFTHGSENIDTDVTPTLDKLASVLQANGGVRITMTAYADNSGTTPREARRLSLSRALAVRDYLTSKGISSSRIDVRALGSNVSSGNFDRVDITAN